MPGHAPLRVVLNPAGGPADIGVGFLERCFGRPWSEAMYRWYLQRPFNGENPDRVMLMDRERAVAGCGLAYRQLCTAEGAVHRVSVIVAAATLPGERGRGCYARVLEAAIDRSAQRGCTALLGFVTAENASARGLRRFGATEVPSAHIVSPHSARFAGRATLQLSGAPVTDRWPIRASARLHGIPSQAGFHYPDASAWRSQMVDRPHTVESLRVGATSRALIESVGDTDRLQWLDGHPRERVAAIRALAAYAERRGRRFFTYSTQPADFAVARRLGLLVHPGYMMALATAPEHELRVRAWGALSWQVQSGDRL